MYKIMLADDESIVIEALQFIIEQKYGSECEIRSAKTGRSVIELAESFRPDIAFMDIQMPGINGIEAMHEIKRFNSSVIFIVMTAYDRFDYAKQAIDLGVLDYLSKPVTREKIEAVLVRATSIIDENRKQRSRDLMIKEKLEIVVPFIESGLIYSLLLDEGSSDNGLKYRELLSVRDDYAYVIILEAGEDEDRKITNEVGSGVRLEKCYDRVRTSLKETLSCIVGPVMANKIVILVPYRKENMEYAERVILIERVRTAVHEIEEANNIELRSGIGSVQDWENLFESYREANEALRIGMGAVSHSKDLEIGCKWEDNYPVDTERRLFDAIGHGQVNETLNEAENYWNWMTGYYADNPDDIRIKVIDYVLWAEHIAFTKGNLTYRFTSRTDYLEIVTKSPIKELKAWFSGKLTEAAKTVANVKENLLKSPVEKALTYIEENYKSDLSLDQVSQMLDMSPYYFSKLFKEEQGTNFIDYLTNIRIEKAKELLLEGVMPVKEIGYEVGYQDPNYFSRIFKKNTGCTPTEFKDSRG